MANHFRLNFNLVELLARVDTDNATDHLGDDNHITEVSLDEFGLLVRLCLLLSLAQLLDQTHGLALQATVEPTTGTSVHNITELLGGEVEESVIVGGGLVSLFLSLSLFFFFFFFGGSSRDGNDRYEEGSRHILVKVNAAVGKLAELTSLLQLCCWMVC